MTERSRLNRKKEAAGAREPGDLIPMYDFQKEFLALRGKIIVNPEMEMAIFTDVQPDDRMRFGGSVPLPTERPMIRNEYAELTKAEARLEICSNPQCKHHEAAGPVRYEIIVHRKAVAHSKDNNAHQMLLKKLGRRELVFRHVGIFCKSCGKFLRMVRYSNANRRAAKDPAINGPHQGKIRYGR